MDLLGVLVKTPHSPCPQPQKVLVNGIHLCKVPVKAWRQLIGYVGQEPVLFATSAMKNIKAGGFLFRSFIQVTIIGKPCHLL